MKVTATELPEVLMIEPGVFADDRGWLMESFSERKYAEHGIVGPFVQDNLTQSIKGVLRGLHYQLPRSQGKLIQAVRGAVFDVAVDIRRGSPRFGQWVGVTLDEESRRQLYIPPGFAHGFCVTTESATLLYKCTDFYAPEHEHCIRWDDPDISIKWPAGREYRISERDDSGARLTELEETLPRYEEPA